jgi:hypothetical protein
MICRTCVTNEIPNFYVYVTSSSDFSLSLFGLIEENKITETNERT